MNFEGSPPSTPHFPSVQVTPLQAPSLPSNTVNQTRDEYYTSQIVYAYQLFAKGDHILGLKLMNEFRQKQDFPDYLREEATKIFQLMQTPGRLTPTPANVRPYPGTVNPSNLHINTNSPPKIDDDTCVVS